MVLVFIAGYLEGVPWYIVTWLVLHWANVWLVGWGYIGPTLANGWELVSLDDIGPTHLARHWPARQTRTGPMSSANQLPTGSNTKGQRRPN